MNTLALKQSLHRFKRWYIKSQVVISKIKMSQSLTTANILDLVNVIL
jgi:hypothetical protein